MRNDRPRRKKKLNFKTLFTILIHTFKGFKDDNVPTLSASLAYATLFSLIPFLSFLVTLGTFFQVDLSNHLFKQLRPIVGKEAVDQLSEIIENAKESDATTLATIVTLAVTVIGASAIFGEIQGSLNTIWGIKAVPKKGWLKYIQNRLLSLSIILMFAFILLVTFTITNVVEHVSDRLLSNYLWVAEPLVDGIGLLINFCITVIIFTLIYKILPDATIKGKDVIVGAVVTTLLFLAGQWGISLYLGIADVGTVYGAAAFMAILITWIYYSAIIIYIGAEFTESWANELGGKIVPDKFAVATRIIEIPQPEESGDMTPTEEKKQGLEKWIEEKVINSKFLSNKDE